MAEEPSNIETFPNTSDALAGVTARQMPNNLPAEQNLLGALLLDNGVMERIDDRLRADHFYDPLHGRIFSTMLRLIDRGQLANPVTLKSFFSGTDDPGSDNIEEYLGNLADGVISLYQSPTYALTFFYIICLFCLCKKTQKSSLASRGFFYMKSFDLILSVYVFIYFICRHFMYVQLK